MPEDSEPDLLDSLLGRIQEGTADQLDRRMREAEAVKQHEAEASQRRLEQMWMREHERQEALAQAQAEQRRQEQMLVRLVIIGAAVIMVVVLLVVLGINVTGG